MEQSVYIDSYQAKAFTTALPRARNLPYMALGLAGEAGEVANKAKKVIRDNDSALTLEARKAILDELGDVLWYVAGVASVLGASLEEVAQKNLDKLQARKSSGTLQGSGDSR
jgi:NTP pyrophosphatase (non-canonical NTP hydrolase)